MIIALFTLVPFNILVVWAYKRYWPAQVSAVAKMRYDMTVFSLAVIFCFSVTLHFFMALDKSSADRAWWPMLSFIASLVIFPVTVTVGGLLRNMVLFKSDKASS